MSTTYDLTITVGSLNVRKDPKYIANGSNIKGHIPKGTKVTATKEQNGWYYVPSQAGWVHSTSFGTSTMTVKKTPPPEKPKAPAPAPKPAENKTAKPKSEMSKTIKIDSSNAPSIAKLTTHKGDSTGYEVHKAVRYRNGQYIKSTDYLKGIPGSAKLNNSLKASGYIPDGAVGDYSDFEDAFKAVRYNNSVFGIEDRMRLFDEFNRFKIPMGDNPTSRVIPYVFFTKPKLDIVNVDGTLRTTFTDENGKSKKTKYDDQLFAYLYNDQPSIFHSLDAAYSKSKHNFNALLSNSAMSFQASDEVLKTTEHGETYTGWKTIYGRHANESNTAGQLSIGYVDNWNYDIYKMHKLWVEYISRIYRGEIHPGKNNIWKKILNYACSIYYIVCAADGETILYWSKYYGVFPINTPASTSSFTHGNPDIMPEFTINYMYALKEDLSSYSISEFNAMSWGDLKYRAIYNSYNQSVSNSLVKAPYIDTVTVSEDGHMKKKFKLRFRD